LLTAGQEDVTALSTGGQQARVIGSPMAEPAYTRLQNDERRRRLLELGERLFTQHSYGELSMARIAREAGISKALLYHYFPSKRDYFVATLASGAEEIRARVEPDPDLPPARALMASLDAYLAWIEEHAEGYAKLVEGAASEPDVREIVERVRDETADRILEGLEVDTPAARAAVRGWLWFVDGVCHEWVTKRELDRGQVLGLLLGTLYGALTSAGAAPDAGGG
jgi:AcrR family transcriptional regulator